MQAGSVGYLQTSLSYDISADKIRSNLQSLADKSNISVDKLIDNARAAGDSGTFTQKRIVNMANRLEVLDGQ